MLEMLTSGKRWFGLSKTTIVKYDATRYQITTVTEMAEEILNKTF